VPTFHAQVPSISQHVAQVQPLGQVVGVGGVDPAPHEQAQAGHESAAGYIVKSFSAATPLSSSVAGPASAQPQTNSAAQAVKRSLEVHRMMDSSFGA
jgi:hypothetical protein